MDYFRSRTGWCYPAEAERNARREFGNELLVREATRDMWGWAMWERMAQDLTYSLRQMRRSPGFTAVSFVKPAIGLGGTSPNIFMLHMGRFVRPAEFPPAAPLTPGDY